MNVCSPMMQGIVKPRMKRSVSTYISVLGFYGYIGYIGIYRIYRDISMDIFIEISIIKNY